MTLSSSQPPIRFGCAGIGGYAWFICYMLTETAKSPQPLARLLTVCEPEPQRFPQRVEYLRQLGVTIVREFDALLNEPVDAVWLPLPIDLHRPFTEKALAAGKAVVVEKPAAATVDDVDAMISARDRSGLPVAVGFQDAFRPELIDLKQRLLSGEFGAVRRASVLGCWPRGSSYYTRAPWAGRVQRDGRWVLDSPASNAMSHALHLALFLLGPTLSAAAAPIEVSAELYRANPIESYDTCTFAITLADHVQIHAALSHACANEIKPLITIETERATIHYIIRQKLLIRLPDQEETIPLSPDPYQNILHTFASWLRPDSTPGIGATLETARAHVVIINAAAEAAPVIDVPPQLITKIDDPEAGMIHAITNIEPALQSCAATGRMLHETSLVPWSKPHGTRSCQHYHHFPGPHP